MGLFQNLFGLNFGAASSGISSPVNGRSAGSGHPSGQAAGAGNWLASVGAGTPKSAAMTVYDPKGTPLPLGTRDEKASGGEGTVYTCPLKDTYLIKIYKPETLDNVRKTADLRRRIMDMVQLSVLSSARYLAWPLMPVFDVRKQVIGFLMRKCSGKSLLALRGPANVSRQFPGWNRRHLAMVSLDFVCKLQQLAAAGVLINDFNPQNILVDERGKVSFIDCDSFQVPRSGGGVNISTTYFASHVAPELVRDRQLLSRPRTIEQVNFGAALTVFYILMCGLHPYNYYDPGHKSACGTPDENLLKGRCPLGRGAGCLLPQGGWYNLWSYLTGTLKSAFITTFKEGHSDPSKRVTLPQLERELQKLIHEMDRDQARLNLTPARPKSSDYQSSSGVNSAKTGNSSPGGRKTVRVPSYIW